MVQRGVLYSGCKIFNNLPLQIRSHFEDLRFFKKKLKSFLIDQLLYSIVEYYQLTSEWLWFLLLLSSFNDIVQLLIHCLLRIYFVVLCCEQMLLHTSFYDWFHICMDYMKG